MLTEPWRCRGEMNRIRSSYSEPTISLFPASKHRRSNMNYLSNRPVLFTLFLTSTFAGIVQGDETSAVAALTKVGAIIEQWDKNSSGEHVARVAFHGQKNIDVVLKNLKELRNMRWL